jgi:hypothetical protein
MGAAAWVWPRAHACRRVETGQQVSEGRVGDKAQGRGWATAVRREVAVHAVAKERAAMAACATAGAAQAVLPPMAVSSAEHGACAVACSVVAGGAGEQQAERP